MKCWVPSEDKKRSVSQDLWSSLRCGKRRFFFVVAALRAGLLAPGQVAVGRSGLPDLMTVRAQPDLSKLGGGSLLQTGTEAGGNKQQKLMAARRAVAVTEVVCGHCLD